MVPPLNRCDRTFASIAPRTRLNQDAARLRGNEDRESSRRFRRVSHATTLAGRLNALTSQLQIACHSRRPSRSRRINGFCRRCATPRESKRAKVSRQPITRPPNSPIRKAAAAPNCFRTQTEERISLIACLANVVPQLEGRERTGTTRVPRQLCTIDGLLCFVEINIRSLRLGSNRVMANPMPAVAPGTKASFPANLRSKSPPKIGRLS
jgi:hypothetical protein